MFRRYSWQIATLVLVVVFIFTRGLLFWGHIFPLGDGGFFYAIVEQVSQKFWPSSINYNNQIIPFAYPPLAFWITTAIQFLTNIPLLSLFIILPLIYNAIFVFLAVLIIKRLSNNSLITTLGCSLLFILSGTSFLALTFGGGIVRGLGSVFFIGIVLAIISGFHKKHPFLFSLLPLAVVLIHPEWGIHSVLAIIFTFVLELLKEREKPKKTIFFYLTIMLPAFIAFVIQTIRIVQLFGTSPIIGALNSSGAFSSYFNYLVSRVTAPDMGVYTLLGFFCGLLIVKKLPTHSWLFFHFIAAYILLPRSSRSFMTFDAILMISLVTSILPTLSIKKQSIILVIAFLMVLTPINFYNSVRFSNEISIPSLISLPPRTTFLSIILRIWPNNMYAEWLPATTDSRSVLTVQGTEWIPGTYRQREYLDYLIVSRIRGSDKSITPLIKELNPEYLLVPEQLMLNNKLLAKDIEEAGFIGKSKQKGIQLLEKAPTLQQQ